MFGLTTVSCCFFIPVTLKTFCFFFFFLLEVHVRTAVDCFVPEIKVELNGKCLTHGSVSYTNMFLWLHCAYLEVFQQTIQNKYPAENKQLYLYFLSFINQENNLEIGNFKY